MKKLYALPLAAFLFTACSEATAPTTSAALDVASARQAPLPEDPGGTELRRDNFEGFSASGDNESGVNSAGVAARIIKAPTTRRTEHFLGLFKNEDVTLQLPGGFMSYYVAFDLYVIGTWDGSGKQGNYGGDTWQISVDRGGLTGVNIFHTSFSNQGVNTQHYPREIGNASSPALSGADAKGTLGYTFCGGRCGSKDVPDATYELAFNIDNPTGGPVTLHFQATSQLQLADDENWGIDNLVIKGLNQ